jgi:hypothetical protein
VAGDGYTALQSAARADLTEMARILVELGATIDVLSKRHRKPTPLYEAVRRGNRELATFLLENGADPNLGPGNHEMPLVAAISRQDLDMFHLLVSTGHTSSKV